MRLSRAAACYNGPPGTLLNPPHGSKGILWEGPRAPPGIPWGSFGIPGGGPLGSPGAPWAHGSKGPWVQGPMAHGPWPPMGPRGSYGRVQGPPRGPHGDPMGSNLGIPGFPYGIPSFPLGIPGVFFIHPRDPWGVIYIYIYIHICKICSIYMFLLFSTDFLHVRAI